MFCRNRTRVALASGLLFLLGGWPGHAQIPTKLNINLVSTVKPSANPLSYGDVWGEGDIACLGVWLGYNTYNYGVGIYSISNPAAPVLLSVYRASSVNDNQFELGALRNRIGYFGSWSGGGVHIVSLTNPASPVFLSRIGANTGTVTNGFDRVHTLFLERDYLYLAAHVVGITSVKVFNIADPFAPVFLQNIVTTNTTRVHQITVGQKGASTILYTSGWGNGGSSPGQTDIWDVTHVGTQPAQWLGRIYSGYNSHSSWPTPDGNTLIVCREVAGGDVRFYDIANPAAIPSNAVPLVTITPASMGLPNDIPHNPVIVDNLLFLSWYQNGIQVFDITDRTAPVRVGFYDTYPGAATSSFQGNWGVFPDLGLNKLLLSDIQTGLYVMDATPLLTPTNNYPPLIVKSPSNLTATQGLNAVLSPVITGSALAYRWRLNGALLPNATGAVLTLTNVQTSDAGNYSVIASNAFGAATSAVATVSVIVPSGIPEIIAHPEAASVYPESPAEFNVSVIGAAPFTYQWRFNGGDIPGATNSSFTLPSVAPEQVGYYSVRISNTNGSATSSNALLTLLDSPYINSVQAAPGSRSALISWNTTLPANSQVQFDTATVVIESPSAMVAAQSAGFPSVSYLDARLSTNHVIMLTGLEPDTRYSYQVISQADTNVYVSGVYQFTTAGTIIIDNPDAAFTGSWTLATPSLDKYGPNYHFASSVVGAPTATATFRPNITTPGKYDVHVWYPQGGNRANNAPYTIVHDHGSTTVLVNQQAGGGSWQLIASGVEFAKGTNGFVRLANNANPSVVLADAVRFTYIEAQDFPVTPAVPRWWREVYFTEAVAPTGDPDADGYTTAQEYLMGTSPIDAESRLQFDGAPEGDSVQITFWPLLGNRSYQLFYRPEVGASNWEPAEATPISPMEDGSGVFTITVVNAPQNFYRLRVQMTIESAFAGSLAVEPARVYSSFATEAFCGPNRAYIVAPK